MAWRFGIDDEEAFLRARDGLVAGFEATAAGRGHGWVAEQLLQFEWGYLDGDFARWTPEDVSENKVPAGPDGSGPGRRVASLGQRTAGAFAPVLSPRTG